MPAPTGTYEVASTGLSIAVREHSPWAPGKQTVVLVHGYPDRQETWDLVVASLPLADLHVVTYDVRGAGGSGAPADVAGYRTELLLDDLVAVLDAVLPEGGRAHLVGHDWGSVQLWDAVAAEAEDPRLHGRIASFTSISGPSLDHVAWLVRHPRGRRTAVLRQGLHSWYVYFFQLPWVPELLWRRNHERLARRLAEREGLPTAHWGPGLVDDATHGLNLYRANVRRRMRRPRPLHTAVPVQVVHPLRDTYLTPVILEGLDGACSDLTVRELDAGHWVIRTDPGAVAALVTEHVSRCS